MFSDYKTIEREKFKNDLVSWRYHFIESFGTAAGGAFVASTASVMTAVPAYLWLADSNRWLSIPIGAATLLAAFYPFYKEARHHSYLQWLCEHDEPEPR